ncbi:MAG TPA: hypothetical protein VF753_00585 [Terriglobales bacterium]
MDSGTFAVLMNGQRVATETFSITQDNRGSSITSHFKSESGSQKAEQTSDLQLAQNGDLTRYEWKELTPGQSHAVVEPDGNFLIQREWKNPGEKPLEQPFLLPASTNIVDDYFFVQQEVLAWRYLATSCKHEQGPIQCPLKQKQQMGTLNPHIRASQSVGVSFAGREKVKIHGADQELIRLDMTADSGDWTLWLDDNLKLQRVVAPVENTEVVRD